MRSLRSLLAIVLMLWPAHALAGAWTLPTGKVQILSSVAYSNAAGGFDAQGRLDQLAAYSKVLTQIHIEYGWNDWLTIILSPEWAVASLATEKTALQHANDYAVEGGTRMRLWHRAGVLSLQMSARAAGGFATDASVRHMGKQQLELRAAYGTGFTVFKHSGYLDGEVAQNFAIGRAASEFSADATLGLDVTARNRVFVQSFNTIAEGDFRPPFGYFREHKLSASVARRLWRSFTLESASYIVFRGQNVLAERGAMLRLWADF